MSLSTDDNKKYVKLKTMVSPSSDDSDDEHFVLPGQRRLHSSYNDRKERERRLDSCPAQLCALCLLILLSGLCALTGYTYYVHARLNALQAVCAKLEQLGPNHALPDYDRFTKTVIRNISQLQSQMRRLSTSSAGEGGTDDVATVVKSLQSLDDKLEVVDTGIEGVQMDVRQLTEERDNIRSTYNDLTRKLIRVQEKLAEVQNKSSSLATKLMLIERLLTAANATNSTKLSAWLRTGKDRLQSSESTQSSVIRQLKSSLDRMSLSLSHLMDQVNDDTKNTRRTTSVLSRRLTSLERLRGLARRLTAVEHTIHQLTAASHNTTRSSKMNQVKELPSSTSENSRDGAEAETDQQQQPDDQ